jgi:hypothetical protein
MMRGQANRAAIWGSAVGAAHFAAICGLAAIVVHEQQSGMAQEYWEYAGLFDVPVSLVLLLLSPLLNLLSGIASWPDVAFLPGITGSWNRFLLPFLFYGVLGTAVWFLLGWAAMRLLGSRHLP